MEKESEKRETVGSKGAVVTDHGMQTTPIGNGIMQLPEPIYLKKHLIPLQNMLRSVCLKCLKIKRKKKHNLSIPFGTVDDVNLWGPCCEEAAEISIKAVKSLDNAYLELVHPSTPKPQEGCWNFLERYGYRYGSDCKKRSLLSTEIKEILRLIPENTRKELIKQGHNPKEEYIIESLRVRGNLPSVPVPNTKPDVGYSTLLGDSSMNELRNVFEQLVAIRSSKPRFELHETHSSELARVVDEYLVARGPFEEGDTISGMSNMSPGSSSTDLDNSGSIIEKSTMTESEGVLGHVEKEFKPAKILSHGGTNFHDLFLPTNSQTKIESSSVVFKTVHSKIEVVVKRAPRSESDEIFDEYTNQRLSCEDSANVLRVNEYMHDAKFGYVVFEYSGCTIQDVVEYKRTNKIEPGNEWIRKVTSNRKVQMELIRDMVLGVVAIHTKRIVHRGLTPQCVHFICRSGEPLNVIAKTSGFGSSKNLATNKCLRSDKSSLPWLAPEQIRSEDESYPVDSFALGCLIYYFLHKVHPFDGQNIVKNIKNRTATYDKGSLSPELTHLLDKLLADKPDERLIAEDVVNHPFFWDNAKRMAFLVAVNELISNRPVDMLSLTDTIGSMKSDFMGNSVEWMKRLDTNFQKHLEIDASQGVKNTVGTNPDGVEQYFREKFPTMLIRVYKVVFNIHKTNPKPQLKIFF